MLFPLLGNALDQIMMNNVSLNSVLHLTSTLTLATTLLVELEQYFMEEILMNAISMLEDGIITMIQFV